MPSERRGDHSRLCNVIASLQYFSGAQLIARSGCFSNGWSRLWTSQGDWADRLYRPTAPFSPVGYTSIPHGATARRCSVVHECHQSISMVSIPSSTNCNAHDRFTLSRAPGAAPPTLIDDSQRELLAFLKDSNLDCEIDRHLALEHQCLDILFRHVRNWQSLQMDIVVNHSDLVRSNEITRAVCEGLQTLKQGLLLHDGKHLSLVSADVQKN